MNSQLKRKIKRDLWERITGKKPLCSLPHRAPKIFGRYWICYRCMGLLIGAWSTTIIVIMLGIAIHSAGVGIVTGIAAFMPTVIDGTRQYAFHRESNNKKRMATGLLGGVGIAILIAIRTN